MSWIFWVVVLGWVIPFVMRKVGQQGQRGGRPPYQQGRRDQYGQYPGNQYPGTQYPAPQQTQPAPPPRQGQPPQGQLPEGQSTAPANPQPPWWQQPLPPGFPGQPTPQARPQAQPEASPSGAPGAPDDSPQGYRARRLAELDRQFSEQKISLEEYMKARNEVMRG